jgi:two-component system, LuxR family, response regulator FixJ
MNHAVPTIYVVDDDPAVRDSLRTMLEAFGMDVRDYASAKAFLADPYRNKRGCLILDLHMPEMGGLELLEDLRQQGSSLPIIVFTGRGDVNLREHVERNGAIALLAKPVDTDLLLQTINRVAWAP